MLKILLYGRPGDFPNYEAALRRAGLCPAWQGAEPLEAFHGLLLPGGGDIAPWRLGAPEGLAGKVDEARDQAELAMAEAFLAEGLPILGVCRGMQVLNVALGGTLFQDIPGHRGPDGQDGYHPVATAPGSWAAEFCGDETEVNSYHHQAVDRLGSGLRAVQWAPDGIVEAVVHEHLPAWGVQWHPERLARREGEAVYQWFAREVRKKWDKIGKRY